MSAACKDIKNLPSKARGRPKNTIKVPPTDSQIATSRPNGVTTRRQQQTKTAELSKVISNSNGQHVVEKDATVKELKKTKEKNINAKNSTVKRKQEPEKDDQSLPQKKQKANVEEAVKQKVKPEEQIVMLELEVKTLKTEYDSKSKRAKVEFASMKKAFDLMKQRVEVKTTEISQLEEKMKCLESQNTESLDKVAELEKKIDCLTMTLTQKEDKINYLLANEERFSKLLAEKEDLLKAILNNDKVHEEPSKQVEEEDEVFEEEGEDVVFEEEEKDVVFEEEELVNHESELDTNAPFLQNSTQAISEEFNRSVEAIMGLGFDLETENESENFPQILKEVNISSDDSDLTELLLMGPQKSKKKKEEETQEEDHTFELLKTQREHQSGNTYIMVDMDFKLKWTRNINDHYAIQESKLKETNESDFVYIPSVDVGFLINLVMDLLSNCFTEGYIRTTKRTTYGKQKKSPMTHAELDFIYHVCTFICSKIPAETNQQRKKILKPLINSAIGKALNGMEKWQSSRFKFPANYV